MAPVEMFPEQYNTRVNALLEAWSTATKGGECDSLADLDGLILLTGDPGSEEEPIRKTSAFQTWILGYEFPSTLILFQKHRILFLCSPSKAKVLQPLQTSNPTVPIEILVMARPKDPPTDAIPRLLAAMANCKRVGTVTKDVATGRFVDEWKKAVEAHENKFELVDVAHALAVIMAVKDDDELKLVRTASQMTVVLLGYTVNRLENIIDKESKITHLALSDQIETRLGSGEGDSAKGPDMRVWRANPRLAEVDFSNVEFAYSPILQSRKSGYDLKTSAQTGTDLLAHKGVFLVGLGLRYKGYCANVGRTFIVDPTKEQEGNYGVLLALQQEVMGKLKDGASTRDIYNHALTYIRAKKPDLEKHFVKSIGFAMGLEFREPAYLLSPKTSRLIKTGMIFNLTLGFADLEDPTAGKYSLQLNDTVKITAEKAICMTESTKVADSVMFFLSQSDDDKPQKTATPKKPAPKQQNGKPSPSNHKVAGSKVLRNKTRGAAQQEVITTSAKIADHQRELHARRQEDGLKRYAGDDAEAAGKEGKGWKRFVSYKGEGGLPKEVEDLRIHIDKKNQTVLLPIHGFSVPFHINTIKNASKSDEGEFTYLRINFQTPGQLAGKKEDSPFEDPDATFIRSVSYRSTDGHRFDVLTKQIQELKKEVNKRELQKKQMADVIEQDNLVEIKGRRPQKLSDVFPRPALDGKRLPGELEIHNNGIRYSSPIPSQKLDLLFSNIKHLFFQPCDNELVVIIHCHLKAPIMMGKKKTKDVQFYREASDVQFDETGNRKRKARYGDEDEIELEQNERKRRQALNKEFKAFAEKISEAASASTGENLDVDIPFRELAFEGVPFRTNVKLQPTTECLVHLSDTPFMVVTLGDIEMASLERVQFGLKQFDMVFIFTDFSRAPLQINSIPTTQLDNVKEWLDSVEIPLSEGPVNLNWGTIMKTINDNPHDFFQGGGWSFLSGPGQADGQDVESAESSNESEFRNEDDVSEGSTSESGSYSDGSNASDDSGSDFGEGSESEGLDWDEQEMRAAKADKQKTEAPRADSDSDEPKKKKSSSSKSAPTKGKSHPSKGHPSKSHPSKSQSSKSSKPGPNKSKR